jgi:hypothetical protein
MSRRKTDLKLTQQTSGRLDGKQTIMAQTHFPATHGLELVLLGLQVFQVVFLWVHDWVPLGKLNDVKAVQSQHTSQRLITITLIQSVPWTIGLCFSLERWKQPYPGWLFDWLLISYSLLLIGQFRAWWLPYLIRPEPARAARYRILFGRTHSFLPPRNGMVPNTAHILLHVATAATLVCLLVN